MVFGLFSKKGCKRPIINVYYRIITTAFCPGLDFDGGFWQGASNNQGDLK